MALVAALYLVAARLALAMAIAPGYATAVWPAAGLAVGFVLAWRRLALAGIWVGSFAANLWASGDWRQWGVTELVLAACIAAGAAVQAWVASALVERFARSPESEHAVNLYRFLGLSAPVASLISATVGNLALWLLGKTPVEQLPFSFSTWWVGDSIGVLIFAPLTLFAFDPDRVRRSQRAITVGGPLLLGFAVVTLLFVQVSHWEQERLKKEFHDRALPALHSVRTSLRLSTEAVGSTAAFLRAERRTGRAEFKSYALALLERHPELSGLGWNVEVEPEELEAFEREQRAAGLSDFSVWEQGVNGSRAPAALRSPQVVVLQVEPELQNRGAVGFAAGSDPIRERAFSRARASGRFAATAPIALVQHPAGALGVLLVAPVLKGEGARPGYAVGVFRAEALFAQVLRELGIDDLHLSVIDESEEPSLPVFSSAGAAAAGATQLVERVPFGGRVWRVTLSAPSAPGFRGWQSWGVLAGGLLLVGLLGVLLLSITGTTQRLEKMSQALEQRVSVRTQELSAANHELQTERARLAEAQSIANLGSWEWLIPANEVKWSDELFRIFGQPKGDFQVSYESFVRCIHPEDRSRVEAEVQRGVREGVDFRHTYRIIRPDAAERTVEARGHVRSDAAGAVVALAGTVEDVTERERLNRNLQTLNGEMREALDERNVLLQEVHHRVKNNLQVIVSLINLQTRKMPAGESRQGLEEFQSRVSAIALIHETIYQSNQYSNVAFAQYVRTLANAVMLAGADSGVRAVSLALELDDVRLPVDKAIPCGLLLNELMTNSLKHAFKDGRKGTVKVGLSRLAEGRYRLFVEDDGVGFPRTVEPRKADSLGLQLVWTLTEQLDGQLQYDGSAGARFQIDFGAP